jgi:hypothetical protein
VILGEPREMVFGRWSSGDGLREIILGGSSSEDRLREIGSARRSSPEDFEVKRQIGGWIYGMKFISRDTHPDRRTMGSTRTMVSRRTTISR